MTNIQVSSKSNKPDIRKITVRCSRDFRKQVGMAALEQEMTVEHLCLSLIAKGLGISEADEKSANGAA